ncbi:hypothetical protein DB347_12080 [Opitutaceae bacterium EW11]|nr:hypothetical protein DB347_12080 [Opitutaceae bacterium EW11]
MHTVCHTLHQLAETATCTTVAIHTFAVGIGSNSAMDGSLRRVALLRVFGRNRSGPVEHAAFFPTSANSTRWTKYVLPRGSVDARPR